MLIFYISQIVGSEAKECPQLEYINLDVRGSENPPYTELIALSSLRCLRSLFINMNVNPGGKTPMEKEDLRVSLYAIAEQGLLEVSYATFPQEQPMVR